MDPWTQFWKQGHSNTFGDYYRDGYQGAVKNWWSEVCTSIAPGATVLELCCGNAALLPGLLSAGIEATYLGVDIAEVAIPDGIVPDIEKSPVTAKLISNTRLESLPPSLADVDLAVSVFGMEYSDLTKSLSEIYRILKENGRLEAVLHHSGSIVSKMSQRALEEFNLEDLEVTWDHLSTINEALEGAPTPKALKFNRKAEKARKKINALCDKYMRDTNLKTGNAFMFEQMSHALKFFKLIQANTGERKLFLQELKLEALASKARHQQMVSVALDSQQIEVLKDNLLGVGFLQVACEALLQGDEVLGWKVSALN